jgi:hypothetical protein
MAGMRLPRFYAAPNPMRFACLPADLRSAVLREGRRIAFRWWHWWFIIGPLGLLTLAGMIAAQRWVDARGLGDDLAVKSAVILLGITPGLVTKFAVWRFYLNHRLHRGIATALAARGRCSSCGYPLTGNVSRVCPECGTPIRSAGPP